MEQDSTKRESKRSRRHKKRSSSGGPNDSLSEIVTRMRKLSLQENLVSPEKLGANESSASEDTLRLESAGDAPSMESSVDDFVVDMSLTFMDSTISTEDSEPESRYTPDPSYDYSSAARPKNEFYPVFDTMTLMKDEHFVKMPRSSMTLSVPDFLPLPDFIPMPPSKQSKEAEKAEELTGKPKHDYSTLELSLQKPNESLPSESPLEPEHGQKNNEASQLQSGPE